MNVKFDQISKYERRNHQKQKNRRRRHRGGGCRIQFYAFHSQNGRSIFFIVFYASHASRQNLAISSKREFQLFPESTYNALQPPIDFVLHCFFDFSSV